MPMDILAVDDSSRMSQTPNLGPAPAITRQKYYEKKLRQAAAEQNGRVVEAIKKAATGRIKTTKDGLAEANKMALYIADKLQRFGDVELEAATVLEDTATVTRGDYCILVQTDGVIKVDRRMMRVLTSRSAKAVIQLVAA